MLDAIRQMRDREGPIYERWLAGIANAAELRRCRIVVSGHARLDSAA
jgi:hypothetical protein